MSFDLFDAVISFFISMVPLIEIRGGIIYALGSGLPTIPAYIICIVGNMHPVPIIFFLARKVLEWGKDKKFIGKFFTFCLEKGHKGGQKLMAGKKGAYVALFLFVGIPLPGNGCVDRNACCKYPRHGFQEEHDRCYVRRSLGRNHHRYSDDARYQHT